MFSFFLLSIHTLLLREVAMLPSSSPATSGAKSKVMRFFDRENVAAGEVWCQTDNVSHPTRRNRATLRPNLRTHVDRC